MLIPSEIDAKFAQKHTTLTPAHAAAEAGLDEAADAGPDEVARRRRQQVQHEADPDPYAGECGALESAIKSFTQASDTPDGYPPLQHANALLPQAAYEGPGFRVPVPTGIFTAGAISRPLITEGRYRPCAPDAA